MLEALDHILRPPTVSAWAKTYIGARACDRTPVYLDQWGLPQYPMSFGGAPGAMQQATQGLARMPGMPGAHLMMAEQPGQQPSNRPSPTSCAHLQ